ncbi:MAG: 2,4-dihydroxyhept-2-ene-1,7-dioic acid aldolase [Clostridia bacterium]|nr:2,4-dihydroxyhept-2-ene-1,7-dioic acid aldolase [Clostridia bacterium]
MKEMIGTWMQIANNDITRILSNKKFDFICADMEHSSFCIKDFSDMVHTLQGSTTKPFARVESNEEMAIRKVLDMGAEGIIVPLVNNKEQAEKAVSFCQYPPEGKRGFAFCQANDYGDRFDEYAKNANRDILLLLMIESKQAVDNIEDILSVKGVDGVFIGPYDMSGSYGITGQIDHDIIKEAIKRVAIACKKYQKMAGIHIVTVTEEKVKFAKEQGFTFLALGMDTVFINEGADNAARIAGRK